MATNNYGDFNMYTQNNWYKLSQRANPYVVQIGNEIKSLKQSLQQINDPKVKGIMPLVEKLNIDLMEDAREYGIRMVEEGGEIWDNFLSDIPGIKDSLPYKALRSIVNLGAQLS